MRTTASSTTGEPGSQRSRSAPILRPGLSGFRPIPPGEGEPFANEDGPDIETTDRHAGEGAAIAVLTVPDDIDRPSPQQTGQPLLGLEPEHEFPFTARAACFGRVDVQDPHPL